MQEFWKLIQSMTSINVSQFLMKSLYTDSHCFPLARLTYPSSREELLPNSNCREHTRNKVYRMRVQGPKPGPSWSQTNHTLPFACHLPNLKSLSDALTHANSVSFYLLIETTLQPGKLGEREGFCTRLNGGITQANPWKCSLELYTQKRWRPGKNTQVKGTGEAQLMARTERTRCDVPL